MGGITGEEAEQLYEGVKSGLTDVVNIKKDDYETEEEYKDAVSESLNETLIENDIQLPTETVEELADHVIENFGDMDVSELTDEQVTSIILQYYDIYASEIE
jgi:phenylalanyl-tRNA synthetase alpha subunit